MFKFSVGFIFLSTFAGIFYCTSLGANACKQEAINEEKRFENLKADKVETSDYDITQDECEAEEEHQDEDESDSDDDKDGDEEDNSCKDDEDEDEDDVYDEEIHEQEEQNEDKVEAKVEEEFASTDKVEDNIDNNTFEEKIEATAPNSILTRIDASAKSNLYETLHRRFIEIEAKDSLLKERLKNRKKTEDEVKKSSEDRIIRSDELANLRRYNRNKHTKKENDYECFSRFCPKTNGHFYDYDRQRRFAADEARKVSQKEY